MTDFHWFLASNVLLGIFAMLAPSLVEKLEKLEKFLIDYANSLDEK